MKPYPLMTHPIGLTLRTLARKSGLIGLVAPLLKSHTYEEAFSRALLDEARTGDCVWDVGANVGYYTLQLSDRVGSRGRIVAFEPSPRTFPKLDAACRAASTNITPLRYALGSKRAKLPFILSGDESGVTDQIGGDGELVQAANVVEVEVMQGDEFVRLRPELAPNVIKIDVEGFEDDVLAGLEETLGTASLRALFVEIHFGALEKRGKGQAPQSIVELFRNAGFTIAWLDHSHLVARKPA